MHTLKRVYALEIFNILSVGLEPTYVNIYFIIYFHLFLITLYLPL